MNWSTPGGEGSNQGGDVEAGFRTAASPLPAAMESAHQGWRCSRQRLPGAPPAAGPLRAVSRGARGRPAGYGQMLCRRVLPEVVAGLGMHLRYKNGRSWCLLRTPHSFLRGEHWQVEAASHTPTETKSRRRSAALPLTCGSHHIRRSRNAADASSSPRWGCARSRASRAGIGSANSSSSLLKLGLACRGQMK